MHSVSQSATTADAQGGEALIHKVRSAVARLIFPSKGVATATISVTGAEVTECILQATDGACSMSTDHASAVAETAGTPWFFSALDAAVAQEEHINDILRRASAADRKCSKLQRTLKVLEPKLEETTKMLQDSNAEAAKYRASSSELGESSRSLRKQLSDTKAALHSAKAEVKAKTSALAEMKRDVDAKRKLIDSFKAMRAGNGQKGEARGDSDAGTGK